MEITQILQMNQERAIQYLESIRWGNKPKCPHCTYEKAIPLKGKTTRPGLYKCKWCKKQFTVTIGTIFEGSHIPLNKWIAAFALVCSSKKGISSHQLHRMLGITYKSAWFMAHRIRYALKASPKSPFLKGTVEVDETYVGGKQENKKLSKRNKKEPKIPVVALVQRNGEVKTKVMHRITSRELRKAIEDNVSKKETRLITDEHKGYIRVGREFENGHKTVQHSLQEYVRGDVYTNTVESYFALLKRGLTGTFHHVGQDHLFRYCDEFNFRWNTKKLSDTNRVEEALKLTEGKRLTYAIMS